ncbi:MAG: hypothetical protein K5840_06600 [Eubacterium sp.]|nr:hypothetical protein [Eubacterium sp.]
MKEYKKPEMTSVEFKANESVAACSMTEESVESYEKQTVNCYIDGSDTVFGDDNCGSDAVSKGYLVDYKGTTYFVWYNGQQGSRPSDSQTQLLNYLVRQTGNKTGMGWHAGTVTKTITSIFSAS